MAINKTILKECLRDQREMIESAQIIPFEISAKEDQTRKRALEAFYAPHPETPELTLDEINEEIRKARQERKERLARENAEKH